MSEHTKNKYLRVQGGGRGVAATGPGDHSGCGRPRPAVGAFGCGCVPRGLSLLLTAAICVSALLLTLCCHPRRRATFDVSWVGLLGSRTSLCRCGRRWRWLSTACCTTMLPQRRPSRHRWGAGALGLGISVRVVPIHGRLAGCARLHLSLAAVHDTRDPREGSKRRPAPADVTAPHVGCFDSPPHACV